MMTTTFGRSSAESFAGGVRIASDARQADATDRKAGVENRMDRDELKRKTLPYREALLEKGKSPRGG